MTPNAERDVNRTTSVGVRCGFFLEQQQNTTVAGTHRAEPCLIGDPFLLIGFDRLKAEYAAIEFDGSRWSLDVQRSLQDPVDVGPVGSSV